MIEADLLKKGSFDEGISQADYVIHTASPFVISGIKDPEKELIEPALEGTRNVLQAVNKSNSVKKVVLTSSVAAIYGDAADAAELQDGVFTEKTWNTSSSLKHQPYSYSKLLAEKEAWAISSEQDRWKLVTINPGFVMGPSLSRRIDSTSIGFVSSLLNGSFRMGVPNLHFGMVDVRDVAKAHVQAIELEHAEGRNILVSESLYAIEMAKLIKKSFPEIKKIPEKVLPDWLVKLFGPLQGLERDFLRRNLSIKLNFDNSKSKRQLNIEYIDAEKTLKDHAEQLLHDKLV